MASVTLPAVTFSGSSLGATMRRKSGTNYITGLNAFSGLKAESRVSVFGLPATADQSFAAVVASLRPSGRKGKGGAMLSTCNAAAEIFRIAAIMNGLVLIGVAVGFVLLRIEAAVEESE